MDTELGNISLKPFDRCDTQFAHIHEIAVDVLK